MIVVFILNNRETKSFDFQNKLLEYFILIFFYKMTRRVCYLLRSVALGKDWTYKTRVDQFYFQEGKQLLIDRSKYLFV